MKHMIAVLFLGKKFRVEANLEDLSYIFIANATYIYIIAPREIPYSYGKGDVNGLDVCVKESDIKLSTVQIDLFNHEPLSTVSDVIAWHERYFMYENYQYSD